MTEMVNPEYKRELDQKLSQFTSNVKSVIEKNMSNQSQIQSTAPKPQPYAQANPQPTSESSNSIFLILIGVFALVFLLNRR